MPALDQPSERTKLASVTLKFQDTDGDGKPLQQTRVRVNVLDANGKPSATLFHGRTTASGQVRVRIPMPKSAAGQARKPLPKIRISVLDLDADVLKEIDVQPEMDRPVPPIEVRQEHQKNKIVAALDDGTPVLGRKLSSGLSTLLKEQKVGSLAALRAAEATRFAGLTGADKDDWDELNAHAQLQLVSRDHKINQALVKAGYRSVLDIARLSRREFVARMKGKIPEAVAVKLHIAVRRQVQLLGNLYTEQQARAANGMTAQTYGGTAQPPCGCDCGSAVSPQAYLVDLLDYAVDNVRVGGGTIDLPRLERTFGQPFAALPVDCAFADRLVRQVRLCVEVLHRRNSLLPADAERAGEVAKALEAHLARAYDALLRGLGTSYRELRLARSDEQARTRLAARLGMAPTQMDSIRLETSAAAPIDRMLNEANLERLFGLQGTARDPLAAPAVVPPVWIAQRKARLRTLWLESDNPANAFTAPMVDPDLVAESDLMQPYSENPAHGLWEARKQELQAKHVVLSAMGTVTDMAKNVLSAPINLAAWDAIAAKLRSADPIAIDAGQNDLRALDPNLTQDAFSFLLELARREAASRVIEPQERQQAIDVLVKLFKVRKFAAWRTGEAGENIRLSAPFFVLSEEELILNPLRVSAGARANWRAELERNSAGPLIDPDIVSESNFAPGASSEPAYAKWTARRAVLGDGRRAEDTDAPARVPGDLFQAVATIDSIVKLDAALTSGDLPAAPGVALFHHLGFTVAQLTAIDESFNLGYALPITPSQFGLSTAELRTLFEVRRLAGDVDSSDWDQVHHILVQTEKRRHLYPQWRIEEAAVGLFLNPDAFHLPSDAFAESLRIRQLTPGFLQWRQDLRRQGAWRAQLKARIAQEQGVDVELQAATEAAEEASLPTLRDDLVNATGVGESLDDRKRWVMNHLLINAFENGCRKTTRVAQAIETIQLLIWGIHSRQFEDIDFSLESEGAETFAEEWRWLGSYATWRSAMFIYLYPENLLLSELRRAVDGQPDGDTDPTKIYQAILKVLSGEAPPPSTSGEGEDGADADHPVEDEELAPFIDEVYLVLDGLDPQTVAGQRKILSMLLSRWAYLYNRSGSTLESGPIPDWENSWSAMNQFVRYWTASAFLEDFLYVPLAFALNQLRRGNFEEALYWFATVYDFRGTPGGDLQGWASPRLELYFMQRGSVASPVFSALDEWLSDTLNPHRIAATRTGADVRFVILSIVRCLLDYADSEYSRDTSESLARARELYETARRLLNSKQLGAELESCEDVIRLISEVGEDEWIEIVVPELDRIDPPFVDTDSLKDEARDRLLDELRGVIKGSPPKPRPDVRKEIHAIVARHFAPKPSRRLEPIKTAGKLAVEAAYQRMLATPKVFEQVQFAAVSAFAVSPVYMSGGLAQGLIGAIRGSGHEVRAPRFEFCIPRNPVLAMLRLRYEVSWFKLNNCMNVAGQHREVAAYAAPTDTYSGLPVADLGNTAGFSAAARLVPTLYRYRVLIERAKQLVGTAQQMEATYLSFLEKRDQEEYTILRARQDLGIAGASVALHDLRVTEALDGKTLALKQVERAGDSFTYYEGLVKHELLESETSAQFYLGLNIALQGAVALMTTGGAIVAGLAAGGVLGAVTTGPGGFFSALAGGGGAAAAAMSLSQTALSSTTGALSSASSYFSMVASYERREQEWNFQKALAEIDKDIAAAQQTLAHDRYDITVQERRISAMSAENASDVVNFLDTKFTNAELYAWMGGVVGGIYRSLLQEATTIAKLAQRQLAFERQESELAVVLDDYWTYTDTSAILRGGNAAVDRRGMTGSVRLLQDVTRLDQEAFLTDRRKLQLSKTLSLALLDPIGFARFRESGVLPFFTTLEQFDRNFPGHYLRLIKRVRVSVIALVPPTEGIRATLSSSGISRAVRGGEAFAETLIRRDPESIAFTSPVNATGLFELQEQPEMLLPFEGNGVAANWEFSMPRAANLVDYSTIADVLVTLEYTAFDSGVYRSQVIQRLDQRASGERPFSFRQQFADAWYDLHHPALARSPQEPMVVSFSTRREDFPPNVRDLKIENVSLYFVGRTGAVAELEVKHLRFAEENRGGTVGGAATTADGLISTRGANAGSWLAMIGKSPVGSWELALPDTDGVRSLFTTEEDRDGTVADILFVVTYGGVTPPWPA